jgi:branched-chain amino acid transport system permease protein
MLPLVFYLQALIDGIILGGLYATIAVGLSLAFGVMGILNWAHGDMMMIGMYISYFLIAGNVMDAYLTIFVTAAVLFVVGFLLQKFVFNPLMRKDSSREPLSVLISTAGLSMIVFSVATMLWTTNARSVVTRYTGRTWWFGEIMISQPRFFSFAIAVVVTILLYILLQKTEQGRALRATSQNREVARLMGINTKFIFCIAFGLSLALVGVAGGLLMPNFSVTPGIGAVYTNTAFIVVVLGGKGNIPGCLISGFIIGIIERMGALIFTEAIAVMLTFMMFIVILLLKPNGIFAKRGT